MGLNALQSKILQPFIAETVACITRLAGMEAKGGDGFEDDIEKFRFKGYAVVAHVKGEHAEGNILMHFYPETAIELGNRVLSSMLGEKTEIAEFNGDLREAMAEFGNTAIGLATKALEESGLGVKFDPPYFIFDTEKMNAVLQGVQEIVTVPIFVEGAGRFFFNYLLLQKTGEASDA